MKKFFLFQYLKIEMLKPRAYAVAHLSACESPVHAMVSYLQGALTLKGNAKMKACKTGCV